MKNIEIIENITQSFNHKDANEMNLIFNKKLQEQCNNRVLLLQLNKQFKDYDMIKKDDFMNFLQNYPRFD